MSPEDSLKFTGVLLCDAFSQLAKFVGLETFKLDGCQTEPDKVRMYLGYVATTRGIEREVYIGRLLDAMSNSVEELREALFVSEVEAAK